MVSGLKRLIPQGSRAQTARQRHHSVGARLATVVALLVVLVGLGTGPRLAAQMAGPSQAEALLQGALAKARAAGSYAIDIDIQQSMTPEGQSGLPSHSESGRFTVHGEIAGADAARIVMTPRQLSITADPGAAREMLVKGDTTYSAEGEKWVKTPGAPGTLGLDRDGLSLLDVAKDLRLMEPAKGPAMLGLIGQRYQRVGFTVSSDDILKQKLAEQAGLDPVTLAAAKRGSTPFLGQGELWISPSGYPLRLIVDLGWRQVVDQTYNVKVRSETEYGAFGKHVDASRFNPNAAVSTGAISRATMVETGGFLAITAGWFFGVLGLFVLAWRGSRRALKAATAVIIAAMLAPTAYRVSAAAEADKKVAASQTRPQPVPGRQFADMMKDLRAVQGKLNDDPDPLTALKDKEDEDGDGLPNGYELQYGTSPFGKDTDFDGLSDMDEIKGVYCMDDTKVNRLVKTNPMLPDSNQDGLPDGQETYKGKCAGNGTMGYAWEDDNDHDGVPDGYDLSPFSASKKQLYSMGGYDKGSNLTFETLDQNAAPDVTTPYPFYVEIQVRPTAKIESLNWAYKTVYWPEDDEASIQVEDPLTAQLKEIFQGKTEGSTGAMKLIPMLSATLKEKDLPTAKTMQVYGASAAPHKDGNGNQAYDGPDQLFDLFIPLTTVESGGQVYAFQAKILHDRRAGNDSLTRHWKDMRLKWAVVADVLMQDGSGKAVPSPANGYGLWVYDEPYQITGLQVQRQGGASMLVATALPQNQPYGDGYVTLLRGGLEAMFQNGKLTQNEIKQRFNTPNNATLEERWGISQTIQYRVAYNSSMNYKHVDEMVATTSMTTTKQLLESEFDGYTGLQPMFLYASEQRTSTIDLDDDQPKDYLDITVNTCLKPLVTSRTLKLQSYKFALAEGEDLFGHWEAMSLDELLTKVENDYAASTPANTPDYDAELLVLKLSATAWYMGSTVVQKVGDIDFVAISDVLTDKEMLTFITSDSTLVASGFSYFKTAVNLLLQMIAVGGPVQWLTDLYGKVKSFLIDVKDGAIKFKNALGSFMDYKQKYIPPDERIKVLPEKEDPVTIEDFESAMHTVDSVAGGLLVAATILGVLAAIVDDAVFAKVVDISSKVLMGVQKLVALYDTIKFVATNGQYLGTYAAAAQGVIKEMGSLMKPAAIVGLVLGVAIVWISVLVQLDDLGTHAAIAAVARAIIDTVLMVVLFVVAAIFPIGTIVAIAIGIVLLIDGIIAGETGVHIDPLAAFLSWLFDVKAVSKVEMKGDPEFDPVEFKGLEPGAGIVAGATFRLTLPARDTLKTVNGGKKTDLDKSWTQLHVGRLQDWIDEWPSICTPSMDAFNEIKKAAGGWYKDEFHAAATHCVYFYMPRRDWGVDAGHSEAKGPVKTVGNHKERTDELKGWVDLNPPAGPNVKPLIDLTMDIHSRYDQCSNAGGCDEYETTSTSAPGFVEPVFDIIPSSTWNLWWFPGYRNYDFDGDGVTGYEINGTIYGEDANLCPNLVAVESYSDWDTDGDGLSDGYEKYHSGFNACDDDTDDDGIKDGEEFRIGTLANKKDTDGDGLTDREELPYDNGFKVVYPWIIPLAQQYPEYPGLPDPVAWPNPRLLNQDSDHRNDKKEKEKLSSPTAYNQIPVGDPLPIYIGQALKAGGLQRFSVSSTSWEDEEGVALSTTLTITLPFTLANPVQTNDVQPHLPQPWLNFGSLQPNPAPNVYRWILPPMFKNRFISASLEGLPGAPTEPLTVTATLEYIEAGVKQVSYAEAPLLANGGGPHTTVVGATGALVIDQPGAPPLLMAAMANAATLSSDNSNGQLAASTPDGAAPGGSSPNKKPVKFALNSGGLVTIHGTAEDHDRVKMVFVCVKTTDNCNGADWKPAQKDGSSAWEYLFNPPADDIYFVRAYGIDMYDLSGPVSNVLKIGVDQSAPASVSFDLDNTAFLSTTAVAGQASKIVLTGQVTDGGAKAKVQNANIIQSVLGQGTLASGYVSGASKVTALLGDDVMTQPVAKPGAPQSSFALEWTPVQGDSVRTPTGDYRFILGGGDMAGNASPVSDTLNIVVDDLAPAVYARLPQAVSTGGLSLSGVADDTAFVGDRAPEPAFGSTKTSAYAKGFFPTGAAQGKAVVAGDLNGDGIDDVVTVTPSSAGVAPVPLKAAIFFGKPGMPSPTAPAPNPDVTLDGESPFTLGNFGPAVAGLGDVNGDGVGDLAVGDPTADSGKGRAYVVLGRRGAWPSAINLAGANWRLGIAGAAAFGGSLNDAGDVNGDGLSDLVVGAAMNGRLNGGAWLFLGREQGAPTGPATAFIPPAAASAAPPALAGLSAERGDTNGDGLADIVIAFGNTPAALVYGRTSEAWPASLPLASQAAALLAAPGVGLSVALVDDMNGDGLAEVVVGDPDSESPRVFIVHGRRPEKAWPTLPTPLSLLSEADTSWVGAGGSRLGVAIAGFGRIGGTAASADIDGDHLADLAVGQPGSGGGPNRLALLLSTADGAGLNQPITSAAKLISGTIGSQRFGEFLSTGDLNGDHVADLLVGAPGELKAHRLMGDFDPGGVAGVAKVELGLFGPVADASQPTTATIPSAWTPAALTSPNARLTAWQVALNVAAQGDYRVYARGVDRAGNRLPDRLWYLGNVWATGPAAAMAGDITITGLGLAEQVKMTMEGSLNTGPNTRVFRTFDGFAWHRMVAAAGAYKLDTIIPHADRSTHTARAIVRDALGNTAQAMRTYDLDTLVVVPPMTPSFPAGEWQTDLSPNLVVSWPTPVDASGIAGMWAIIDTEPETSPTTPVAGTQVAKTLTQPGVYYAHLKVKDIVGNEAVAHAGPFLVNRKLTPSVILPDGQVDLAGGEYPDGTLLNYDPFAAKKPAAVWGTWDAARLYLGLAGHNWSDATPLTAYFDTKAGGLKATLGPTTTHTLPFDADYALVVGRPARGTFTLMKANGGGWSPVASPKSLAVVDNDTEMVLDRNEIELSGALGLVALAEDEDGQDQDGVWAVLPAAARPATDTYLTDSVTLASAMPWAGLTDLKQPNQGLSQSIQPEIAIDPEWDNVVSRGKPANFIVTIKNPDIGRYANIPFTMHVDPSIQLASIRGATCQSCPPGASEWTLLADVAPGSVQKVYIAARTAGDDFKGVKALKIEGGLAGSGIPASPMAAAEAMYQLDHGTAKMKVLGNKYGDSEIYVQPGDYEIGIWVDQDNSDQLRCSDRVEVNPGNSGWKLGCYLGDCTRVGGTIGRGGSQVLEVRASGPNGIIADSVAPTIIADDVPPVVQISPTLVLSGPVPILKGLTWDPFPVSRTPVKVEVSLDGGKFWQALIQEPQNRIRGGSLVLSEDSAQQTALPAAWSYQLRAKAVDGQTMSIMARAVDEAGNVGRSGEAVRVYVDTQGPQIEARRDGGKLAGSVSDRSGVAWLKLSLDGGTHYEPVAVNAGAWTYDLAAWPWTLSNYAMFRAADVHGNTSRQLLSLIDEGRTTEPTPTPTPTRRGGGTAPTVTPTPTSRTSSGPTATPTPTSRTSTGPTATPTSTTQPTNAPTPTATPNRAAGIRPVIRFLSFLPWNGKRVNRQAMAVR